jgi:transketolase
MWKKGVKATLAAAKLDGPVYLRFAREKSPIMTTSESPFELGKAQVFWRSEKSAAVIFATGPLIYNALLAAKDLEAEAIGTTVVNIHTIKPLDAASVVTEAKNAGAVVTVEEHQVAGGFGSAIAEVLARELPTPIEFIGVQDRYGQSGEPKELIEHYGMGPSHIKEAVKKAIARKT